MSRQPVNGYRSYSNGNAAPTPNAPTTPRSNGRASSQAPSSRDPTAALSRAERFEDEKRRIIDSCFAKTDETGQLQESYITHIRITEDALYPSTPPPPDSGPENKKPRLIIIAVRNTGRVRMHKARENNNGTFSIGKTWNMEELNAIESFSNIPTAPRDDREAQYRTWAGTVGFVATITKPYYWQAGTSKEKDFFIASAVKIYKKYTKGQVPELRGFDDKERAAILGTAASSTTSTQSQPQPQSHSQPPPSQYQSHAPVAPSGRRPSNAAALPSALQPSKPREQSRDASRYRTTPGFPERDNDPRTASMASSTNRSAGDSPGQPRAYSLAPAQRQPQQPPQNALRHYASSDRMRSQSRDPRPAGRSEFDSGTSAYNRANNEPLEPISLVRSHDRSDSPTIAASRARSPSRQRSTQELSNRYDQDRQRQDSTPSSNGVASGAALFASTRMRLQEQQRQQSPQQQPSSASAARKASQPNLASTYSNQQLNTYQPSASTSHLPPLSVAGKTGTTSKSPELTPGTATSGASSGFDLSDAATVGAITSFWADPANNVPNTKLPISSSPATPERSKRRPTMESKPSTASMDLRPAPLSQARKASEAAAASARSPPPPDHTLTQEPPRQAESAEVRPLAVQNKVDNNVSSNAARAQALDALSRPEDVSESRNQASPDQESPAEEFRPGLGPMIRQGKTPLGDKLMKAANKANAFKPRRGGAAEKILKARAERDAMAVPDGINAVVPRPEPKPVEQPVEAPRVEVIPPTTSAPVLEPPRRSEHRKSVTLSDDTPRASLQPIAPMQTDEFPQPQPKIKRRSAKNEKYLTELGIDRSLLEGKGLEFESLLDEFGWRDGALRTRSIAELEQEVKRELGRVEAGSWLSQADSSRDEKVQQVEALLDKAIAECDDLDGLLTLYSVELGSLNEDIAFIEAQSQGLQVQSANQRVLYSELKTLVETMSLNRSVMEPLRYGNMTTPDRLEEVEQSLVKLYEALVTMDPSMRSTNSRPMSRGGAGEMELSRMAALREKKDMYARESTAFCQRLMQHLDATFSTSLNGIRGSIMQPIKGAQGMTRLNKDAYNHARSGLWMYSPVVLFTKEANTPAWQTIIRMYYTKASPLYLDAFKENLAGWKRAARSPAPEEAELLFTHQEKEAGDGVVGLTSTARKLTVKRSQTLAKSLRNASGHEKHTNENRNHGAMMASEVFAAAMDEMAPLISQEQNFIIDMFHVTSTETSDFMDTVHATRPIDRHGTNLLAPKPAETNREMSRRVHGIMDEIFTFFSQDVFALLEWAVTSDPIQGVGVMAALSKHAFYLEGTSQEFLLDMLDHLRSKLRSLWNKFIDDQIRAIEDTKVKIHKRKGVISFMKVFPHFSAAVENVFSSVARNDYEGPADCVLEVRKSVDVAYAKLNRAMFDSLKVIAKESPSAVSTGPTVAKQGGVDDPEDKEMLNYYILIIENMNHYIEEVDDGGKEGVLAEWRGRAMMERLEALEAYLSRVIRRPLGKLLDFIESLESLMLSHAQPTSIASRPSYSRKSARSILAQFDGKEIRRGIETLRRRIEKHFVDGDEEALARPLVTFVTKEGERSYEKIMDRAETLIGKIYPPTEGDKNVELEFTREDVRSGFRR